MAGRRVVEFTLTATTSPVDMQMAARSYKGMRRLRQHRHCAELAAEHTKQRTNVYFFHFLRVAFGTWGSDAWAHLCRRCRWCRCPGMPAAHSRGPRQCCRPPRRCACAGALRPAGGAAAGQVKPALTLEVSSVAAKPGWPGVGSAWPRQPPATAGVAGSPLMLGCREGVLFPADK